MPPIHTTRKCAPTTSAATPTWARPSASPTCEAARAAHGLGGLHEDDVRALLGRADGGGQATDARAGDKLGALTADITDLTDSKGTTVNPHEVMGLTAGHGDIACSDCHGMHRETVAADTCVGCHHAGFASVAPVSASSWVLQPERLVMPARAAAPAATILAPLMKSRRVCPELGKLVCDNWAPYLEWIGGLGLATEELALSVP